MSGSAVRFSDLLESLRPADCGAKDALIALADTIPTPALSMLPKAAPASFLKWMLEILGDPAQLDARQWSLIGTEVRAGADGYPSQTSVPWGPDGHVFSVTRASQSSADPRPRAQYGEPKTTR